ncbi:Ldh family oxidoreductase [Ensifer sp. IC3342]|nr:Ldh family oxidoreductase [Ensifer sp. BRP08]MCA1448336.1 Ldh family oxidoreductase [Ensifer sp. IC3342]
MSSVTLDAGQIHALIFGALVRSRTSEKNAASVADALVEAELAGQGGHGLRRVAAYAAQAKAGKVDGFATPTLEKPRPAVLAVDAANGFAFPALDLAVEPLGECARSQGVALAGFRRSHHCGVAGVVVERYARNGLVALMFANAPGAMAPWDSTRPLFGTNPVAFAAPIAGADPLVVDISLSKVARGKIMAANQKGGAIPPDWAFDADGKPTTDPKAALAGTMAPVGDAKGTALALMVELLAAGLTGANYAYEATSFFDDKGAPPGVGQLIVCIDPTAFGSGTLERFAAMADMVSDAPGARLPGRRRQALRQSLLKEGIPVDEPLIAEIESIGR